MRPDHRLGISVNGFTLLEVMVALAVFSLAALSLMKLQAFAVRSGVDIEGHEMAWQVARNRAAELLSDPAPPTFGTTNGTETNAGRNFTWQQDVKRTDDRRIIRIDVVVTGADGSRATIKLARPSLL